MLQTYTIPLADFARATPGFDARRLTSVRWRFDRSEAGTVWLDDIGIARLGSEWSTPAAGGAR